MTIRHYMLVKDLKISIGSTLTIAMKNLPNIIKSINNRFLDVEVRIL